MTAVDVAVIGAGTAGAAAACVLAPSVSVALVDRVEVPGWRIGETLPGAARRLLAAIGGWDRFAAAAHGEAPLKVSRWGSGRGGRARRDARSRWAWLEAPIAPGSKPIFALDALARGARFVAGDVVGLRRTSTGWQLPIADGTTIAARRLIVASGRRSSLLRPHGQRRLVLDRLACVYQRMPQPGPTDPTTYTEAAADGWWYTAVLPGGERIVAFHGDAGGPALRRILRCGLSSRRSRSRGWPRLSERPMPARAAQPELCAASSVARSAACDRLAGGG